MQTSEQINEIGAALAKAQAKIEGASKDSDNPYFKSRYADLASVWSACRDALTANGIAVVQSPEADGPKVTVTTLLTHSSGQWIRGSLAMTATKADPQGIGSCVTYARRYSLAAMVGVCPEDDDGNAASEPGANGAKAAAKPPARKPKEESVAQKIDAILQKQIGCKNAEDAGAILGYLTDGEYTEAKQYRATEEDAMKIYSLLMEASAVTPFDQMLEKVKLAASADATF